MNLPPRVGVRAALRPGLALGVLVLAGVAGVAACGAGDRSSVGEPNPDALPPSVATRGEIQVRQANEGAEHLVLRELPDGARAQLLWLEGRRAAPTAIGDVYVTGSGGELLRVSDRLRATAMPVELGGRGLLTLAAGPDGGLWATDVNGQVLEIDGTGRIVRERAGPFHYSTVATDPAGGRPWFARSSAQFVWHVPASNAPVLVGEPDGESVDSIGQARLPAHILLVDLANAGHLAVLGDRLFFAPFIRDELVAMTLAGDTVWVATRGLPQGTDEPAFEVADGKPVINYHPVNLGLTVGPNGHLYLLSTPGFTMTEARLDEFDPGSGELLRTGHLASSLPTLAADKEGRVFLVDPARLEATVPPESREAFPAFDLPSLDGGGIRLEDLRGQVTVVNFWASWCAPCRHEMPALDTLARDLKPNGLRMVGLNDDDNPEQARAFLAEINVDMETGLGMGDLRNRYGLPGLPVTMLLDADLRIAARWIGELSAPQMADVRRAALAELRRSSPAGGGDHVHH